MGFRSTLTSFNRGFEWPDWFKERYARYLTESGVLFTPWETKTYIDATASLPTDVQRALVELTENGPFVFVWLHECGGITRVQVTRDQISVSTPADWHVWSEWVQPDNIDQDSLHNYCYGCSDAERFRTEVASR